MVRQIRCGGRVLDRCHKVCGPLGENGVGLSDYNILVSGFRFNGGEPTQVAQEGHYYGGQPGRKCHCSGPCYERRGYVSIVAAL